MDTADEPTSEEFAELFSDDGVTRYADTALPAGITDPAARFALTAIGLPRMVTNALMFDLSEDPDEGLPTLDTIYEDCPPEIGRLFALGFWDDHFVALDGTGGEVSLVRQDHRAVRLARTLRLFLTFVHLTKKTIDAGGAERDETLQTQLTQRFRSLDPTTTADGERTWRDIIRSVRYD